MRYVFLLLLLLPWQTAPAQDDDESVTPLSNEEYRGGTLRVGAFAIGDVEDVELGIVEADFVVKGEAFGEPFVGEAEAVLGAAEILDLHLLEFTRAEGEVPWIDLVAE